MTTRRKILLPIGFLSVMALAVIGGASLVGAATGNDDSTPACSSGQWVRATVVKANGEKLTATQHRQVPNGYSSETASGDQKLTINSDGSVEAEGGAVTVECITPTK